MAGDHREIVADEQERHPGFRPKAVDQLEDSRLDGDVERRRRLVGDDEARRAADRHGDHRPLPLAARQRERIGVGGALRIGEPHVFEQLHRTLERGRSRHAPMQDQRFGDLPSDAMQGIEGRHRLLKDHRDPIPAQEAHGFLAEADELAPLEAYRAGDAGRVRSEAHQRQGGHRLAGAGFADDAEALAVVERKRRAVDDALHAPRVAMSTTRFTTSSSIFSLAPSISGRGRRAVRRREG